MLLCHRSLLRQCWRWTVLFYKVLRILIQRFKPSLFTKFNPLRYVTPERNAWHTIDSYLTEKEPRKILWMDVLGDFDDFALTHRSQGESTLSTGSAVKVEVSYAELI